MKPPKLKKHKQQKCPECKSTDLFYDDIMGELVCSKCGLVIEEEAVYMGKFGGNQ